MEFPLLHCCIKAITTFCVSYSFGTEGNRVDLEAIALSTITRCPMDSREFQKLVALKALPCWGFTSYILSLLPRKQILRLPWGILVQTNWSVLMLTNTFSHRSDSIQSKPIEIKYLRFYLVDFSERIWRIFHKLYFLEYSLGLKLNPGPLTHRN